MLKQDQSIWSLIGGLASKISPRLASLASLPLPSWRVENFRPWIPNSDWRILKRWSLVSWVSQCYRAPELFELKPRYCQWSDVWALGCILYDMLVLKRPFKSEVDILRYSKSRTQLRISYSLPINETTKGFVSKVIHNMLPKRPKGQPIAVLLIDTFGSILGSKSFGDHSATTVGMVDNVLIFWWW